MQRDTIGSEEIFDHLKSNTYSIPITDTHCHLNIIHKKDEEFLPILRKLSTLEDILIIDIGLAPSDYDKRVALFNGVHKIYFALGMHPCEAASYSKENLRTSILDRVQLQEPIAIGEIGLDWYRMYAPKDVQIKLFCTQIEIAMSLQKPFIVHSRHALDDIIAIVHSYNYSHDKGIGILHCFEGDCKQAKQCIDLGFYISFAANTSYSSALALQDVIAYVPEDRLLAETDSPFLLHKEVQKFIKKSKKKYNGLNYPLYLSPLYELIAKKRNTSVLHISQIIRRNTLKLFDILH